MQPKHALWSDLCEYAVRALTQSRVVFARVKTLGGVAATLLSAAGLGGVSYWLAGMVAGWIGVVDTEIWMWRAIGGGAGAVFVVGFVSPFLLWREQRDRIEALENEQKPRIRLITTAPACFEQVSDQRIMCRLGVLNPSFTQSIHGLSVEIVNLRKMVSDTPTTVGSRVFENGGAVAMSTNLALEVTTLTLRGTIEGSDFGSS